MTTALSGQAWYGGELVNTAGAASLDYSETAFFGLFRGGVTPGQFNHAAEPRSDAILINEANINPPGDDLNFEYIELLSTSLVNSGQGQQSTNGLEFNLFWDNRDYPGNPSAGNALILKLTRDWGLGSSSGSWTSFSTEYDHYVSLGTIRGFRQSVLALDFWSAFSPSWESLTRPRSGTITPRLSVRRKPEAGMFQRRAPLITCSMPAGISGRNAR